MAERKQRGKGFKGGSMAPIRLGGLASGLDTDKMIRDIMKTERMRVDKVEKQKTRVEWKQTALRDLIAKTRGFHGKFFDILKPETNMMSPSTFSAFEYSIKSGGVNTSAVEVRMRADAPKKDSVIDSITRLAKADVWTGGQANIAVISGFEAANIDELKAGGNLEFSLVVGKVIKNITISETELGSIGSANELATVMNQKIAGAFGAEYGNIVSANSDGVLKMSQKGSQVRIIKTGDNALFNALRIRNGSTSHGYLTAPISEVFGITDEDLKDLSINGVNIKLDANMNMKDMFRAVNTSGAGVNIFYDSLADRVVLRSTETGTARNITVQNDSKAEKVLAKIFGVSDLVDDSNEVISSSGVTREKGENALLSLNGTQIVQDSNQFTIDGITYTLNALSNQPINISAKVDKDKVFNTIKTFVDEYNALIDEINTKLAEPRFNKFEPLTDDEKAEITERQAEKIEEKAKSGILNGDRELEKMIRRLRSVMIDTVEGGFGLNEIGIKSNNWRDKGKLHIDSAKLKSVIENDLDKVVETFTKVSSIPYGDDDKTKVQQRYKENGLMARLDDVFKDFVRTTRDKDGNKGSLIMIAGLEGDASLHTNKMTKEIKEKEKRIEHMMKRLAQKEDYYYRMFAQMEASLAKMQSQQASFANFIGGMNRG